MSRNQKWRRLAAAAAVAMSLGAAGAPEAKAQFFPPLGAASPGEIAARLRAQGFALTGPLIRRGTVYLADVKSPSGRQRLVLDAWSGEILQSFVARGRDWRPGMTPYVVRGGEFDSPPPLAPPPKRDFLDPGEGTAGPVILTPDGSQKPKKHPAKTKEAKAPPEPEATPSSPAEATPAPSATPGAAPSAAAPVEPTKEATPNAPALTGTQPKGAAPEKPVQASAPKPGDKKVNDVPVNTLE